MLQLQMELCAALSHRVQIHWAKVDCSFVYSVQRTLKLSTLWTAFSLGLCYRHLTCLFSALLLASWAWSHNGLGFSANCKHGETTLEQCLCTTSSAGQGNVQSCGGKAASCGHWSANPGGHTGGLWAERCWQHGLLETAGEQHALLVHLSCADE